MHTHTHTYICLSVFLAKAVQSSETIDTLRMQPIFIFFKMDSLSTSCPQIKLTLTPK